MPQSCLPKESFNNAFKLSKVPKARDFFRQVSNLPDDFDFPTVDDFSGRKTDVISSVVSTLVDDAYNQSLEDSQLTQDHDIDSSSVDSE